MQIVQDKKNTKKIVLISLGTVITLALLTAGYLYVLKGTVFGWSPLPKEEKSDQVDYNKPSSEQVKAGQDIKKRSIDSKSGSSGSDQPSVPVPQSNGKSKVDISITAAEQVGSLLQIRTIISAVASSGTCTLTLEKSGQPTVTKTADIQNGPSTSTCKGFDINVSEITVGEWRVTIVYEGSTLTGTTNKVITVK